MLSALLYFMQPCLLSSTLWLHPLSIYDEQFILFWLGTQWERLWFFNKGGIRKFFCASMWHISWYIRTYSLRWPRVQKPIESKHLSKWQSRLCWQELELILPQYSKWIDLLFHFEVRSNKLNRNDEEIPGSKSSKWVQIAAKWPSYQLSDQSNDQRKVVWPTAMCADVSSWQFSDQQQVVWSKLVLLHTALKSFSPWNDQGKVV